MISGVHSIAASSTAEKWLTSSIRRPSSFKIGSDRQTAHRTLYSSNIAVSKNEGSVPRNRKPRRWTGLNPKGSQSPDLHHIGSSPCSPETIFSLSPKKGETKGSTDEQERHSKDAFRLSRRNTYWQDWLLPVKLREQTHLDNPKVTALSYCALLDGSKILLAQAETEKRQIASLTKIMMAYTTLTICRRFGIRIRDQRVTIQSDASFMEGTSANLKSGDNLLLIDLLYGLMLPSGNDASVALAQFCGKFMSFHYVKDSNMTLSEHERMQMFDEAKDFYDKEYRSESIRLFVFEMNKNAKLIGLKNTQFSNPTGLNDVQNYSTAADVALLSAHCLKDHIFQTICRTKMHRCEVLNEKLGQKRQVEWHNTNKHLYRYRQCIGVKTGNTPCAGPCLSSAYRLMGHSLVIVLLNCPNSDDRYSDASQIYRWCRQKLTSEAIAINPM